MSLNRLPGADVFEQAPRPVGDRDRAQGVALAPAARAGSTTATDAPSPIACLIAAASANPDAPPPAMTTSKTGAGSAIADASFSAIVGRIRSPISALGRAAPFSSPNSIFSRLCGAISDSLTARPEAPCGGGAATARRELMADTKLFFCATNIQ